MVYPWLYAFALGGIGSLLLVVKAWLARRKLPPGPAGWPLVGNAFQQDPVRPHLTWARWSDVFGDVFTVYNFGKPTVMCNTYEAICEMYVTRSNDFAGRPSMFPFWHVSDSGNDVASADFSPEWIRRKKVFMSNIKVYGDGLDRLEKIMVDIIAELVQDVRNTKQEPFNPQEYIELALTNTLSLLLLGDKFERSDQDFRDLLEHAADSREILGISFQSIAVDAFPWLRHLPLPFSKLMDRFIKGFMQDWAPRQIQKRLENYKEVSLGCVLDAYVKQYEEDAKTGARYPIEKRHLVAFVEDFFLAGINTSTATLYSQFATLTARPDVQDRVREEVDRVLAGRRPQLRDREAMPYLQAVQEEVMRYSAPVPVPVPHKATVDSQICGHFIPKGTEVIPNIWPMFHDEKFWGDPWKFRPERFLDDEGQLLPIDNPLRKRMIAFGAGRRKCPGELLARNRIFLITSSLMQNFVFKPVSPGNPPVYDPRTYKLGIAAMAQPYKVIAVPRD